MAQTVITPGILNKEKLNAVIKERAIPIDLQNELQQLLMKCETAMYTGAVMEENREVLLLSTNNLLDKISTSLIETGSEKNPD